MLDKKHSKTWVKVVAWSLAVTFGLSFSFMVMLPQTGSQSGARPVTTPVETTPEQQAGSLAGQGDIALKNKDYDQAISFFEPALKLAPGNEENKSKLAGAYYEKGKLAESNDSTVAKESFNNYLEVLPNGPKAAEVKKLLSSL